MNESMSVCGRERERDYEERYTRRFLASYLKFELKKILLILIPMLLCIGYACNSCTIPGIVHYVIYRIHYNTHTQQDIH